MNAPIVVFAYNRLDRLKLTIDALAHNHGARESELYIYCDGAKKTTTPEQVAQVKEVHEWVKELEQRAKSKEIGQFKDVHVKISEKNKGLADSIVGGVTEVVNRHGRVIVFEDDIVSSPGLLNYLNDALELYKDDENVMHISGYMYPHKCKLPETFFLQPPYPAGGWATWKRAWQYYNDDTQELYDAFKNDWKRFNTLGGNFLQLQLEKNLDGSLHTWFIKWHAVLLLRNALTLYPSVSLSNNIGWDNSGTTCYPTTRYTVEPLAESIRVERIPVVKNRKAEKLIRIFYQGHWYSKRYRYRFYKKICKIFGITLNI